MFKRFWGLLDIIALGSWFVGFMLYDGNSSFNEYLTAVFDMVMQWDEPDPMMVLYAIGPIVLSLSYLLSGLLLLFKVPLGVGLAYLQTPFRILFSQSSLFMLSANYFALKGEIFLALLIVIEVVKLKTLRTKRTDEDASRDDWDKESDEPLTLAEAKSILDDARLASEPENTSAAAISHSKNELKKGFHQSDHGWKSSSNQPLVSRRRH